ncbi:hypothetical protein GCM10009006_32040 [Haloarcula argentinensis]|nr:hypothetical protein GCM10009006_32040 [Haloarcula argentinensis]
MLSNNEQTTATPISTDSQVSLTSDVQLNISEAKERALEAETSYVSTRLKNASCLDSWDIGSFTAGPDATVINQTNRGVVIKARRPYSWEKGKSVYDAEHYARYLVTKTELKRLSGDTIEPC